MLLLVQFLHPKRFADSLGIQTEVELPQINAEMQLIFQPLQDKAHQAAHVEELVLDEQNRSQERFLMSNKAKDTEVKRRVKQLLVYVKDYDIFEALNQPTPFGYVYIGFYQSSC